MLARRRTLTLFSGDGSKRLHVFELGAPLSTASVSFSFGRDGALLTLTSRSLEVRRDGSLVTSETAPPSTPREQQHVLLRRLIKRVTIGVTDEFGSALLPPEDAGHHWPDATHMSTISMKWETIFLTRTTSTTSRPQNRSWMTCGGSA